MGGYGGVSFNNVIPGDIARDPEKLQALVDHLYGNVLEPVLPGMEEWAPEDETEAQNVEEIGEEWRLVDATGREVNFRTPPHISRYSSERSARIAAARYRNQYGRPATPQKGSVTWSSESDPR